MGKQKIRKRRPVRRIVLFVLLAYLLAAVLPYAFVPEGPETVTAAAMLSQSAPDGDRAVILPTGEEALEARLNLIANAQSSLIVGTYLYADDESGRTIAAALLAAADRGVRVRIVTDGLIGAANLLGSELGYALGSHSNIELRYYNPVNVLAPWGLSSRYHEKYVIADDRVFVLGGRNISDEFLTAQGHPSYNYDMDVLIWRDAPAEGSASAALVSYFDTLWETRCAPRFETVPAWRTGKVEALVQELRERYKDICDTHAEAVAPIDWSGRTVPIEGFALLSNPTDAAVKQPTLWAELIGLMKGAKERVWIQTPYLVLNGRMRDELNEAASLEAEMTILTNSRAGGNNIVASADAVFHRSMVNRMPLNLYEFQGDASMHTKTMLIDGDLSVFGSFNFDMRSAYSDTELMLVVQSSEINEMLEEHMLSMLKKSLPVNADGSYGTNGDAQALSIDWMKNALILAASPFISLVRFLV